MTKQAYLVEGREVLFTNLDKVLWPEEGYTKRDLLTYYARVGPWLLPHLAGRPLVLNRFPDGIKGKSFYQKECPEYAPAWLKTVPLRGEERVINYCLAEDLAGLLWLANQGCLEMHPWLSRYDHPDRPDVLVWDFDPMPSAGFREASRLALLLGRALEELGFKGYPKTSGASGLHVYLPLKPLYTYAQVREAALVLGRLLAKLDPARATLERQVQLRGPRVYVDCLQNVQGKTLASVYSVRPEPGATVSTPLAWEELEEGVEPGFFTILTVPARLERVGDLFKPVLHNGQRLDPLLNEVVR